MVTLVGIVGGIGSGKSAVSDQFRQLGAEVLDGDKLGHEVLLEDDVIQQLTARWGDRVLQRTDAGVVRQPPAIDRKAVAAIVFGDATDAETELRYLESVVHWRIRERIRLRIEQLESEHGDDDKPFVAILDAPLLLEAGWNELCDHLIFVDVPRETRLKRVQSRGWDAEELAAREAYQLPIAEKRQAADWIVDNSGPLNDLPQKIAPIWRGLTLPRTP